jgi:hypothetical protein
MADSSIPYGALIGAGGAALSAYLAQQEAERQRQAQANATATGQLFTEGQDVRHTALAESQLDPFRQQMSQGHDLTALDVIARARNTPVQIGMSGKYAGNMPQISGGFSYDMSPQNRADALALQASIRSGQTAPTMTDKANYGRTSVLNLANPGGPTGYAGAPAPTAPGVTPSNTGGAIPRTPGAADVDLTSSYFGGGAGPEPSQSINPALLGGGGGGGGEIEELLKYFKQHPASSNDDQEKV